MKRIWIELTEVETSQIVNVLSRECLTDLSEKIAAALAGVDKTIHIIWSIEDVQQRAEDNGVELTEDEQKEALALVEKYHDCNYGVTWESLDNAIHSVVSNREA